MKLPNLILPPLPQSPTIDPQLRTWAEDISRYLLDFNQKTREIPFNNSEELEVSDTGAQNTEFSIRHHLNRVPQGFIALNIDKPGIIYKGDTAWTETYIYLKCSVANAKVKLLIF
jgi:hypothetical protein